MVFARNRWRELRVLIALATLVCASLSFAQETPPATNTVLVSQPRTIVGVADVSGGRSTFRVTNNTDLERFFWVQTATSDEDCSLVLDDPVCNTDSLTFQPAIESGGSVVEYVLGPRKSMTFEIRSGARPKGQYSYTLYVYAQNDDLMRYPAGYTLEAIVNFHAVLTESVGSRNDILIDFDSYSEGKSADSIGAEFADFSMSTNPDTSAVRLASDFDVIDTISGKGLLVAGAHSGLRLSDFQRKFKSISFAIAWPNGFPTISTHGVGCSGGTTLSGVGSHQYGQGHDAWTSEGFVQFEFTCADPEGYLESLTIQPLSGIPFMVDEIRLTLAPPEGQPDVPEPIPAPLPPPEEPAQIEGRPGGG